MEQIRLFRLATEVIHIHSTFVAGEGWHVTFTSRRQDESWADTRPSTYSHLTTDELLQVIDAELSTAL